MREEQSGAAPDEETFGVLPENWDAAQAFFACSTQWRHDGAGIMSSLRYEALDIILERSPCADRDDTFRRIQVMEHAAIVQARRLAPKK